MIRNIFESKGFKKESAYEQLHTTKYGTIGIRFSKDIMTMYVADDNFNYEELKEDIEDKGIYYTEGEILEPLVTNGWTYIQPEDIGALTSATIISNDFEYDEETDEPIYYSACAYMDYQVKSFAEELLNNNEAVWQYEKLIDETNNTNETNNSNEVLTEAKKESDVQTVVFKKDNFTVDQAKKWLKDNKMKYGKVDEKDDTYRFRQLNPEDYKRFRTKEISKGVSFVFGYK